MFLPRLSRLPHTSATMNVGKVGDSSQGNPISIDLASPWLFGFDASRPEDAPTRMREDHFLGNNIYQHPARWGRRSLRFTKPHDVYSLVSQCPSLTNPVLVPPNFLIQGVVLLEIAFWKDVISLAEIPSQDTSHKPRPLVAEKVRAALSAKCDRMLPHQVGKSFTDTILSCLDFEKNTKDLEPYEMHRYYETQVVEKIAKAVGRV